MKKTIMMMFLLSGFAFTTQSQGFRKPPSIDERVENAKKELSLSDEQADQWREVHEKYENDMKDAMKNRDRTKGKAIREEMEVELSAILDEDQKAKFEELKKEKRGRRGGRRK